MLPRDGRSIHRGKNIFANAGVEWRQSWGNSTIMLDHASLGVTDIHRSRRFYDATLRPLGLARIVDFGVDRGSDYGAAPASVGVEFTITMEAGVVAPSEGAHLCFRAPNRDAVHAFYLAALANRPARRPGKPSVCLRPFAG